MKKYISGKKDSSKELENKKKKIVGGDFVKITKDKKKDEVSVDIEFDL